MVVVVLIVDYLLSAFCVVLYINVHSCVCCIVLVVGFDDGFLGLSVGESVVVVLMLVEGK